MTIYTIEDLFLAPTPKSLIKSLADAKRSLIYLFLPTPITALNNKISWGYCISQENQRHICLKPTIPEANVQKLRTSCRVIKTQGKSEHRHSKKSNSEEHAEEYC